MPSFGISAYYRQSSKMFCNFRRFSLRVRFFSLLLFVVLVCGGGLDRNMVLVEECFVLEYCIHFVSSIRGRRYRELEGVVGGCAGGSGFQCFGALMGRLY